MKNMFTKIGLLALLASVSFSCSKVQYASFGGGPKKLTALPSKDYYGNLDKQSVASLNTVETAEIRELNQTITKLQEKLPAVASGKKLSLVEKVAVARQVNKIQKQLAKVEKVSEAQKPTEGGKSQIVALILAIVIGGLGIHRFYLGYTLEGVLQLLTAGGCGIWALIDIIRIATGDLKPKGGDYDQKL
jgi:TM2 domain-containing membrane protein YozV